MFLKRVKSIVVLLVNMWTMVENSDSEKRAVLASGTIMGSRILLCLFEKSNKNFQAMFLIWNILLRALRVSVKDYIVGTNGK